MLEATRPSPILFSNVAHFFLFFYSAYANCTFVITGVEKIMWRSKNTQYANLIYVSILKYFALFWTFLTLHEELSATISCYSKIIMRAFFFLSNEIYYCQDVSHYLKVNSMAHLFISLLIYGKVYRTQIKISSTEKLRGCFTFSIFTYIEQQLKQNAFSAPSI